MTRAKTPTTDRATAEPAAQALPADRPKTPAARVRSPRPPRTAAPEAALPAAAASAGDPPKPKQKLVRDSFTIPKAEYAVLDALKLRAAQLQRPTKKSEVLRAGIAALNAMSDKAFLSAINGVPSLKTGRPKATVPPAETAPG